MAIWHSKKIEKLFDDAKITAKYLGTSPHTAYFHLLSLRGRPSGIHAIDDTVFHIHQLYNLEKELLFIRKDFYILVYNTRKGTVSGYEANEEDLEALPGLDPYKVFSPYPDPPYEDIWTSVRINYYLDKAYKSFSKKPKKFDSLKTAYFVEILKDLERWDYATERTKGLVSYIYQILGIESRLIGLVKDFYVVNEEPKGTYTGFEADEHELVEKGLIKSWRLTEMEGIW
jgi:hypothetical protein